MDSLQDILARYDKAEEPDLQALKSYVRERFRVSITAALHGNVIVATVPSAALAATLRLQSVNIQSTCKIDKRIIFRIG